MGIVEGAGCGEEWGVVEMTRSIFSVRFRYSISGTSVTGGLGKKTISPDVLFSRSVPMVR